MTPLLAFGLPGGAEWVWIFLAIILLFGAKKLPELARGLGKSMGEFKKAKAEFDREIQDAARSEPEKPEANKPSGTVENKNN